MSKIKLRRKCKIFANKHGIIERAGDCHWVNRETIKRNTRFNCELNSLFIEAIKLYETLPFAIHKLWIEIIDDNTSQLIVAWNGVNQRTIHDLSPFWMIYYSLKFERGLCEHMHYAPTIAEAMNHLIETEVRYQVLKLPKEKYMEYRKQFADKRLFDNEMRKTQLEMSRLSSKRKRELKNKTKYTWRINDCNK